MSMISTNEVEQLCNDELRAKGRIAHIVRTNFAVIKALRAKGYSYSIIARAIAKKLNETINESSFRKAYHRLDKRMLSKDVVVNTVVTEKQVVSKPVEQPQAESTPAVEPVVKQEPIVKPTVSPTPISKPNPVVTNAGTAALQQRVANASSQQQQKQELAKPSKSLM